MPAESDSPAPDEPGAPGATASPADSADTDDAADFDSERRKQLLTAPKADENDAAPRIDVTEVGPHTTRIDVRDDAAYRPGI
ncbi:hypothetical protein [Subtercola sp. Z020]|uniref:hypothetical protein n=1 Tax=Subtercola sp. Z020 TaxID=2080582 RepID=UPI0011B09CF3|nr:hypothetical protein [Subtercola sp. Z020]